MKLMLALALACGSLTLPAVSNACSCIIPDPAEVADEHTAVAIALKDADIVFSGEIESTAEISKGAAGYVQYAKFRVLRSWKGEISNRVTLKAAIACCVCDASFPRSGRYLVYAYGPDENGYYGTSTCTRTKPLDEASQEITLLDELESVKLGRTRRSRGRVEATRL